MHSQCSSNSLQNALIGNADLVNETLHSIKENHSQVSRERELHVLFIAPHFAPKYKFMTIKKLYEVITSETMQFHPEHSQEISENASTKFSGMIFSLWFIHNFTYFFGLI